MHKTLIATFCALMLLPVALPASAGPFLPGPDLGGLLPCRPDHQDVTTGGNSLTGVADAFGASDAQWTVTRTPLGVQSAPAYSIPPHSAWAPPSAHANWVNPWPATTPYPDNGQPGGTSSAPASGAAYDYEYEVTFNVDTATYDRFTLSLAFAADNTGHIHVNNGGIVATTGPFSAPGFTSMHTLQLVELRGALVQFQPGLNTITVHAYNVGLYTGILVDGRFTQDCIATPCVGISELLSTGLYAAPGTDDPRWYMETVAGAATPSHPPAKVVPIYHTWTPGALGQWINPYGSNAPYPPTGTYEYSIAFELPCLPSDCTQLHLWFDFAADDDVRFELNGVAISSTYFQAWSALTSFQYDNCGGVFQVGANVLTAIVENSGGGPTGLLVSGGYTNNP